MRTELEAEGAVSASSSPFARAAVSLRHRDFRLLITGTAIASAGYWALVIAQGWLVVQLTDSKLVLGLVNAALSLPFLFIALPAGVLADRTDRKRLMTLTRAFVTLLLALLALLTFTDLINVWLLSLIAFTTGSAFAMDLPTRQSLAPELVEPHEVTNAVAVNQLVFTGTTLIGPTIGGLLLAWTGAGGAFALTAIGNAFLLYQVRRMRFPARAPRMEGRSAAREIRQGVGYVLRSPVLQPLVLLNATVAVLGQPYQSFLPALAKDVLRIGAGTLGLLYAAGGAGAVAGAATVALLGDVRYKGRIVLSLTVLFGLLVIGVSLSRALPLTLLLLACTSFAGSIGGTLNSTILVTTAPDALRGRVMSVNVLVFGLSPFGNLLLGALADRFSVPTALALSGLALIAVTALTAAARPRLRAL